MKVSSSNLFQIQLIRDFASACEASGVKFWLLGGWGIDALLGKVLREHHDIDLIVAFQQREGFREVIRAFADEIHEDSLVKLRFFRNAIQVDTRFYQRYPDGILVSDLDSDDRCVYPWPPGAFPEEMNGELLGTPCRAISWEAQYVAKQGYSHFDKGAPLHEQDRADLTVILDHLPRGAQQKLHRYLPGIPRVRPK